MENFISILSIKRGDFMSTYFGISSNYNFFGTSSSNSTSGSNLLSDYGLIRSGAYKKLMNAYYGNKSSSSNAVDSETEQAEKKEKLTLRSIKSGAEELYSSAQALKKTKLFEGTLNKETGETEYNREEIKKLVSSFVEDYNATIEAVGDADTTSVLRKTVFMIGDVKANDGLLEDVGISIGEDNKLKLDETKLSEANMSTLKSIFTGAHSVADKVMSKASEIGRLSGAAINRINGAVSYTSAGDYKNLSTSSIYESFF